MRRHPCHGALAKDVRGAVAQTEKQWQRHVFLGLLGGGGSTLRTCGRTAPCNLANNCGRTCWTLRAARPSCNWGKLVVRADAAANETTRAPCRASCGRRGNGCTHAFGLAWAMQQTPLPSLETMDGKITTATLPRPGTNSSTCPHHQPILDVRPCAGSDMCGRAVTRSALISRQALGLDAHGRGQRWGGSSLAWRRCGSLPS